MMFKFNKQDMAAMITTFVAENYGHQVGKFNFMVDQSKEQTDDGLYVEAEDAGFIDNTGPDECEGCSGCEGCEEEEENDEDDEEKDTSAAVGMTVILEAFEEMSEDDVLIEYDSFGIDPHVTAKRLRRLADILYSAEKNEDKKV